MIDLTRVKIKGGNGGAGGISFRREKFVPRGGPDGGDGGRGGDVIIKAVENVHLLRQYRYKRNFAAENGSMGKARLKTGKSGNRITLEVPTGTLLWKITESGTKELVADLAHKGEECIVAHGGASGKGNAQYVTSSNQEPLIAENGELGEEVTIELEMKLLADVGIVGNPSVGKSSLLRACSRAHPEVAAYPFTTLEPVLGFVQGEKQGFIAVEVPGLIEGAHNGTGLGDKFLRHIERTRVLIHLLDGTQDDCLESYYQVREEMYLFNRELIEKPHIIVINKLDLQEVRMKKEEISSSFKSIGLDVDFISAETKEGVTNILAKVDQLLALQTTGDGPQQEQERRTRTPTSNNIEQPRVTMDEEVYVVESPKAERLVNRVDLTDRRVQIQLWEEFKNQGIVRALERAGAKSGRTVRFGKHELDWA